jgi:hypothetical protein
VILPDGAVQQPVLGSGDQVDAFAAELSVALEAVRAGTEPPPLASTTARNALAICLAEVESVLGRRAVRLR